MSFNGRPTRHTRSQMHYNESEMEGDDEAGARDEHSPRSKSTIRLRVRAKHPANGVSDGEHEDVSLSNDGRGRNDQRESRAKRKSTGRSVAHALQRKDAGRGSSGRASTSKDSRAAGRSTPSVPVIHIRRSPRVPASNASQTTVARRQGEARSGVHRATVADQPFRRALRSDAKRVRFDYVRDQHASRKSKTAQSGPENEDADGHYDNDDGEYDDDDDHLESTRTSRSGRRVVATYKEEEEDSDDEVVQPKRRSALSKSMDGFVVNDDDGEGEDADGAFRAGGSRRSSSRLKRASNKVASLAARRSKQQRRRRKSQLSSDYEDNGEASMTDDDDDEEGEPEEEEEDESDEAGPRSYSFRRRTKKVDYRLAAPPEPLRDAFGKKVRSRSRSGPSGAGGGAYDVDGGDAFPTIAGPSNTNRARENWNGLPLSMTGKDYDRYFGAQNDDSSDDDIPASRKPGAGPALLGGSASGGLLGAGGVTGGGSGSGLGPDLGAGRDAVGRMKGGSELADIDPLGVNMQVDFSSVGGLDHHIQQLKEMVSLPLLYPEVFQRFKVTPPRGVLFHGPPGTGKTLVARALAASCSSSGQQISFFMRKGADCLSKWVGEAERQLRLLFEEAKNAQPSIIFFDEIDGLAPVRSSKQDQIHASIVSTLLALMDGMDGRGQVVVIGATNRPDSVDPALRRPGRFDREFYFPLPNLEARKSIISINTKEWEPPLDEAFKDKLAEVTKGYGGADLRALCTEAALNAIQRRYPQIYQTTDRLELKPETISVDARDFMISVNKVVPSSARSSGSAAAPLKEHLQPLLGQDVHNATQALQRVLPPLPKRNPLEEAQWEDDVPASVYASDGGFNREMLLQSFDQLRIFRPRLILHGNRGMGQRYIGNALLHHLEGYHVQTLDAGTLLGDSGTTMEASIVQMFNEAKRHKPSVLYIPALAHWADTVTESARTTFKTLLDGLSPSDPVLLIAICEGRFEDLPRDIRSWFGFSRENRVELSSPDVNKRRAYFDGLIKSIIKPPNEFPDGLPRRKRILESLPIAPPRAPRAPTVAELKAQKDDDDRILNDLKFRLGPILGELKKKFPRFKRDVWQEYNLYELTQQFNWRKEKNKVIVTLLYEPGSQLLQRLQEKSDREGGSLLPAEDPSRDANDATADEAKLSPLQVQIRESEASQTNGMALDGKDESGQVQAQAQMQLAPPSALSSTLAVSSDDQEGAQQASDIGQQDVRLSGLAAAMTGDFSTDNPAPINTMPSGSTRFRRGESGFFERDLPIWTVNLEKMQKRLYYNGYLTVSDFVEDIQRIVSNAEEAQEVDEDRLSRANQLFITANYLADQYFDVEFRARCERMAARTVQREAEARKADEEEKKRRQEAAQPSKGERQSSRLRGVEPVGKSLDELAALERKRVRQDDEADSSSQMVNGGSSMQDGEEMRKRIRTGDGDGDASMHIVPDASLAADQLQNIDWSSTPSALGDSHESRFEHAQQQQPTPSLSAPLPLPSYLNGHSSSSEVPVADKSVLSPIVKAAATPPAPSTPHPAFTYDAQQLRQLEEQLIRLTGSFSVEQLEQLRATLYTLIWNRRGEWDKGALLVEMAKVVDEVAREVEDFNREEQRQDLIESGALST